MLPLVQIVVRPVMAVHAPHDLLPVYQVENRDVLASEKLLRTILFVAVDEGLMHADTFETVLDVGGRQALDDGCSEFEAHVILLAH